MTGDADAIQTPTRRFSLAMFAGAMVGIILMAVFGVIGFLHPSSNDKWQRPGVIVVQKGTATRFLYLNGSLRPILNLASARLLVGADAGIVKASAASLSSVPHGPAIGILGAPDTLSSSAGGASGQWPMCASTRFGPGGNVSPFTSLLIDEDLTTRAIDQNSAAAVQGPDGSVYLAWRGERLRMPDRSALVALGFDRVAPNAVSATWLNRLPAGPDLQAPNVHDRGSPAIEVAGTRGLVGQVYATTGLGGARSYYVMQPDGLMPVTPTEAALILAGPRTSVAYPNGVESAIAIGTDQMVAVARSGTNAAWRGLPDTLPIPIGATQLASDSMCVQLTTHAGADATVSLVAVDISQARVSGFAGTSTNAAGDTVTVSPNRAVLVVGQGASLTAGQTISLVTDVGVRFPLKSTSVQGLLGYAGVTPIRLPSALLDNLPVGPTLDPTKVVSLGAS